MSWVENKSVVPSDQRPIHTRLSIAWRTVLCGVLDGVTAIHARLRKCEVDLEICLAWSWQKTWLTLFQQPSYILKPQADLIE